MLRQTARMRGTVLWVLLALAFVGLATVADARDKSARRYLKLSTKAHVKAEEGRWEDVLRLTRKMDKIGPEASSHHRLAAQGHAMLGHRDVAYEELEKLIAPGWHWPDGLDDMEHLEPLRGDERFKALSKRAGELGRAHIDAQRTLHRRLPIEDAESFESAQALIDAFDSRLSSLDERAVLMAGVVRQARVSATLDAKIAAAGRYLADHPQAEDRERVALEAVRAAKAYKGRWDYLDGDAAIVIDMAERFLAGWPDSEHRPEVELIRAVATWKSYGKDEREETLARRASEAKPLFLALEEGFAEAPEAARAKIWRLGGAMELSDGEVTPEIEELYAEIEPAFEDDEELKRYAWDEAARAMFQIRGEKLFDGVDLDGNRWTWETMKGEVVLIDFWATWCGPCVAEIPHIQEAYEKFGEAGFRVVGVSLDGGEKEEFLEECDHLGVEWPQIFDGKGWDNELARKFSIMRVPTPVLVDRDGRVAGVHGAVRGEKLLERLAELIDPGPASASTAETPAKTPR